MPTETITTLSEVLDKLDESYKGWKGGEKNKNKYKDEFFRMAVEALKEETLAEKVVEVKTQYQNRAIEIVGQRYPEWEIVSPRDNVRPHPDKPGYYEVIIRENPYYKPFSIEHNGKIFQRQIVAGSALLDDERLQEENPELWEKVTFVPEPERQLKDLDELDPTTLAELQEYMYQGKPQVKFPAPKVVKEDG